MEPSEKLKQSILNSRTEWQDLEDRVLNRNPEDRRREAAVQQKRDLINRAQEIAETHAKYESSHMYLAGKGFVQDHYSRWVVYRDEIDGLPDVCMQARLTKRYRVLSSNEDTISQVFGQILVDFRLYDRQLKLISETDEGVITFGDDEIAVRTDEGVLNIDPGTNEWFDVSSTLETIAATYYMTT